MSAKYVTTRPNTASYQFDRKVPADLQARYGKRHLRKSLKTSDKVIAMRKAEVLNCAYEAEFALLRGNRSMTPSETLSAGLKLANELGDLDTFAEHYADPKLHACIESKGLDQGETSEIAPKKYMSPVDLAALAALQRGPDTKRLNDAFTVYKEMRPDFSASSSSGGSSSNAR